jgi:hypothetical protein
MSVEDRVLQLEKSFQILTQLAVNASERSEQQLEWINQLGAAQVETESKLAALIDAQVRTEDALAALTVKVDALVDAQARADARLDRLAALLEQHVTEEHH